jgi:hypothetical protein
MLSWSGDRVPLYGECVALPPDGNRPDVVVEGTADSVVRWTGTAAGTIVRVGYDLFREVRVLLTTGQPATHAGIPTLEKHIAILRDTILGAGVPLVEIPPIPAGYRFITCLTHDVDHPSIRLHRLDRTTFGFLYRAVVGSLLDVCRGKARVHALGRNWAAALSLPLVHLGLARDFWLRLDRYLEIEQGLGSTFFVIPAKNERGRTKSGRAPKFRASRYGAADIAGQLRALRAANADIELHGLDAWLDRTAAARERARVGAVTGVAPSAVRMHWLFFDEGSPARLEEGGFLCDSTFGYNETVGFRAGTPQAFRPLTAQRLLELPLTIMDTALFYPSYLGLSQAAAKEPVWRLVEDAERYGGALTINWHDRSLAPERQWGDFYLSLVEELKQRSAWFPTVSQAATWFHQRRSAVLDTVRPDRDSLNMTISADWQQALPGLIVRVHPPGSRDRSANGHRAKPRRFTDMMITSDLETSISTSAA